MADKTKNEPEGSETMDQNTSLLLRVIEVNQGFAIKNWETIAAKEGLSVATAKQRFGILKKQFMTTADSAPPVPVIRKRKRAALTAAPAAEEAKQINEHEGSEKNDTDEPMRPAKKPKLPNGRTPLPTLDDKRRAEAARARDAHRREFQARLLAHWREWGLEAEEDEKKYDTENEKDKKEEE